MELRRSSLTSVPTLTESLKREFHLQYEARTLTFSLFLFKNCSLRLATRSFLLIPPFECFSWNRWTWALPLSSNWYFPIMSFSNLSLGVQLIWLVDPFMCLTRAAFPYDGHWPSDELEGFLDNHRSVWPHRPSSDRYCHSLDKQIRAQSAVKSPSKSHL